MKLRDLPTADCIDDSEELEMIAFDLIELLLEVEEILTANKRCARTIALSKITLALESDY